MISLLCRKDNNAHKFQYENLFYLRPIGKWVHQDVNAAIILFDRFGNFLQKKKHIEIQWINKSAAIIQVKMFLRMAKPQTEHVNCWNLKTIMACLEIFTWNTSGHPIYSRVQN